MEQLVYHAVMEFAPWPMAEVEGKAHVVQAVNPAFCALLEKSEAELVGKPIAQLFKDGHATHGLLDRVLNSGEAATHVETETDTPGPKYWSYTCWPVQAKDARHVGLMIQVTETTTVDRQTREVNEALLISAVQQHELTDVADKLNARLQDEIHMREELDEALRESQRFLRSSLDALSGHLAVVDASGTILEVNEAWQRFASENGYATTDHGIGSKYLQELTVPDELVADYAQGINNVLAESRTASRSNTRAIRPRPSAGSLCVLRASQVRGLCGC